MMLVVSPESTVLYDQFEYVGEPEDFAWVLPIRGQVEVGLATDWILTSFDQATAPVIEGPSVNCGSTDGSGWSPSDDCYGGNGPGPGPSGPGSSTGSSTVPGGMEVVEVLAQETVGPYETVQLSSADPQALTGWLEDNGYVIPVEVAPLIATYVAEDFDFLVLRLAPGVGVQSMRPVWVKTPGASFDLPLRMVAAGTGATTAMTLFVLSEGRYGPDNFPSFVIDPYELVWSFTEGRSNYRELRAAGFEVSAGFAWLTEASYPLQDDFGPAYVEVAPEPEDKTAAADLATFVSTLSPLRITRLSAELSREALATDLRLWADPEQSEVIPYFQVEEYTGDPCGFTADCHEGVDGEGGAPLQVKADPPSGCLVSPGSNRHAPPVLAFLAVATLAARRLRVRRAPRP
jgi:hypothetical protein